MRFFNKISRKTTEATNKIAREAKLKMKISDNKCKIKDLYEEIGKISYESHIREKGTNLYKKIKDNCLKIDKLSKEIEEYRKEILTLNHKKMCIKCYAEIGDEDLFCPKCGKKQTEEEETTFEKAEQKIETVEVPKEKSEEAKIVKEELEQKNNDN